MKKDGYEDNRAGIRYAPRSQAYPRFFVLQVWERARKESLPDMLLVYCAQGKAWELVLEHACMFVKQCITSKCETFHNIGIATIKMFIILKILN